MKDSKETTHLEADNRNSTRIFQEINNQIATMRKTLDSVSVILQKRNRHDFKTYNNKRMKTRGLVRKI